MQTIRRTRKKNSFVMANETSIRQSQITIVMKASEIKCSRRGLEERRCYGQNRSKNGEEINETKTLNISANGFSLEAHWWYHRLLGSLHLAMDPLAMLYVFTQHVIVTRESNEPDRHTSTKDSFAQHKKVRPDKNTNGRSEKSACGVWYMPRKTSTWHVPPIPSQRYQRRKELSVLNGRGKKVLLCSSVRPSYQNIANNNVQHGLMLIAHTTHDASV